jgi:hypothetical protein
VGEGDFNGAHVAGGSTLERSLYDIEMSISIQQADTGCIVVDCGIWGGAYVNGNVPQISLRLAELDGVLLELGNEGVKLASLVSELGGVLLPPGGEVGDRLGHPLLAGEDLLRISGKIAQEVHVVHNAML